MLDIGWSEILIIAVVALIVVGPKELPQLLRVAGQWAARARRMAGEFQSQMNEAIREAELDDVRKSVQDLRALSPKALLAEQIGSVTESLAKVERETNAELARLDAGIAPTPPAEPEIAGPEVPGTVVVDPPAIEAGSLAPAPIPAAETPQFGDAAPLAPHDTPAATAVPVEKDPTRP
ncbi:twin-arginine translocase subunit TatB [Siculibacillus lacustris]|uniref:Sec-independent protein translocase protein TatB n=1 Tax=Siculibacillus lacustris TaxID=1549641 RepID=A0A4Q9VRG3_9HYPH|nr:Sec-independent protein translocase protein TatB [Siculibacillus lacustris]TBW37994.1 twin-arginine translocase subunit TatB [Siculibacillus lacustris]